MAHDVFISYSHSDKSVADAICANLEQEGIRCWYAPRDIEPGEEWAASIIKSIKATKILILVYTDASNASRQVLNEINAAVENGVVIIPFRLTMSEPSESIKYYLSAVHWMDAIKGPQQISIKKLVRLVRSILGGLKPSEAAKKQQKKSRKDWKKPTAIALAAILLALGGILAGRILGDRQQKPAAPAAEETLYVYRDHEDPDNHFPLKARMAGVDQALVHNMDENCRERPFSGTSCIRCSQDTRKEDWGGWLFLSGYISDDGDQLLFNDGTAKDQGMDLSGAARLVFSARGEKGGETVEFFACGFGYNEWNEADCEYPDSAVKQTAGFVTLTDGWQEYAIDLTGVDMSNVSCGFGYVLSGDTSGEGENVFYLDDIRYVGSFSG